MKTIFVSAFIRYNEGKHEGLVAMQIERDGVRDVIDHLKAQNIPYSDRLLDDKGVLRRFINIYVNGEDIRSLNNIDTPVKDGDEVDIVVAIAGG